MRSSAPGRPGPFRVLIAGLALVAAGCATVVDTTAERRFLAGDERGAIEAYSTRLEEPSKREALDANLLATAAMVGGDHETARRAFIDAGRIMGSFPSAQTGAIVGAEGSKIYLGDPYEAAMNSLYTAMLLIEAGDEENARAALKSGILADSDVAEEEYKSDVAALFLLEAWLSLRIGKDDLARLDLEQVRTIAPNFPLADPELLRAANTLIVIDIGDGPRKVRSGPHGELATFVVPDPVERHLNLTIDDRTIDPALGVDVAFQANTRGGREMDGILRGKAVFKDVSTVSGLIILDRGLADGDDKKVALGGGLLLLSALTRAEADVRHWHLLPSYTYLWIGHVPPGLRSVSLRFRGPGGAGLADRRQSWHHVPFEAEGPNVYYFRSGPRKGYGHAPDGNPSGVERGSP